MKKFIVVLLIAVILGGTAFFFGWVQLTVPPGSYGVMRSKTHGLDPEPIREGRFRWVWYKLIPTNVLISVYSLKTIDVPIRFETSLPSAEIYASLSGLAADFSYKIDGVISFTLRADSLPSLISAHHITDEAGLREYEDRLAEDIRTFVVQRIRDYAADEDKIEELLGLTPSRLQDDIAKSFPAIENLSCSIHAAHLPDIALYHSTQALYKDYLDRQRELLQPEVTALADRHLSSLLRLDELAKYGELLTKYPMLLQYLSLEGNAD
ncbi:MAG: hypothetical protein LBU28_11485 [Spirochaetaceae bacterium]|jgi:hypothetical protein|nr:hypothetical protein [Spirochaetaceae bacterium]